jgi:hypothetical protein
MLPSPKYRIVGVRADGSTRTLCADISDSEVAQRVAGGLGDGDPFIRIIVERYDDVRAGPIALPEEVPDGVGK